MVKFILFTLSSLLLSFLAAASPIVSSFPPFISSPRIHLIDTHPFHLSQELTAILTLDGSGGVRCCRVVECTQYVLWIVVAKSEYCSPYWFVQLVFWIMNCVYCGGASLALKQGNGNGWFVLLRRSLDPSPPISHVTPRLLVLDSPA